MNQEQVIEMVRESGLIFNEEMGTEASKKLHRIRVERFAALVAAHERKKHQADIELWKGEAAKAEKWRGMALAKDPMQPGKAVREIQREAAACEREACALVCESWRGGKLMLNAGEMTAQEMRTVRAVTAAAAAEIRARGNKEGV